MQLRIKIHPGPERETSIAKAYWQLENNKFVHKPTALAKTYGLSGYQLTKIIRAYSSCEMVTGDCQECGREITVKITAQCKWNERNRIPMLLCKQCIKKGQPVFEIETGQQIEERKRAFRQSFIRTGLCNSIAEQEFEVLQEMVKAKVEGQIIQHLFLYHRYDYDDLWHIIFALEAKGLIRLHRTAGGDVDDYGFDEQVVAFFFPGEGTESVTTEHFSFTLLPNQKTAPGQPQFASPLLFVEDITLRKGEAYLLQAYSNSDGTILVTIKQDDQNQQTQPLHLRDIIEDFYSSNRQQQD